MKTKLSLIVVLICSALLLSSFQIDKFDLTANTAAIEESMDSYLLNAPMMMDTVIGDPLINYPDPFCNATTIEYILTEPSWVSLVVICPKGSVEILVLEFKEAGVHKIIYDACNKPCGRYTATLSTNQFRENELMVKIRSNVLPVPGSE